MAFIGIFLLAWAFLGILIIIGCAILFFFIPCTILSIISLVQGIKYHWQRHNIIILSVTAPFAILFLVLLTAYLVWRFVIYVPPYGGSSSVTDMLNQAYYVCQYVKYLIF